MRRSLRIQQRMQMATDGHISVLEGLDGMAAEGTELAYVWGRF